MQQPPNSINRFTKCIYWLLLLLLFNTPGFAQTAKIKDIQQKLDQSPPDTARLRLLQKMADAYTPVDPAKKFYYASLFRELAVKLHNEPAVADAYFQMGASYAFSTKLDSALYYFKLSYNQAAKVKYIFGMGKGLSSMGFIYDRLDDKKQAIQCDFQSLQLLKNTNNKRAINQLYINIGSIYFDLRQYKLAQSYFKQCLISYTASKDTAGIGYGLFLMGNAAQALRQDDKALDYFTRSLTIRQKLGDANGIALVKRGMGQAYFHKKQYDQSVSYLNIALQSVRALKDKYEESAVLLDLSDVYLAMNQFSKSADCAQLCMDISKEMKSPSGVSESLERLIATYKKKGDLAKAFEYQTKYLSMQQEIANANALKDVTLTEFSRIRTENATLAKDNRIITTKNTHYLARLNKYSNTIVIIVVILASVILLLVILYRRNLEKLATNKLLLRQTEEIATINKELETLNEEINTQMELTSAQNIELERLNNVKNKFFSIISHDVRGPLATLQTLFSVYREGDISKEDFGMLLARLEDTLLSTSSFLDNLLEWSKNQLEGIVIKPVNFDINKCIAENIQLFESKIGLKDLQVESRSTGPIMVYADRNMITLVIRNLLSNSIKFCSSGDEITFSAMVKDDRALIAIADTGPGITEADRENLFNLEHTLSTGTQNEKGNHLGLILCRDMIVQNNGTIWFETQQDKGTTFWIDLPAGK